MELAADFEEFEKYSYIEKKEAETPIRDCKERIKKKEEKEK